jgi:dienelactone hydrolase
LSPRAEELRKRLQNAGKTFAVDIFKNAGHAFFADYRQSYREPAAFELWPRWCRSSKRT